MKKLFRDIVVGFVFCVGIFSLGYADVELNKFHKNSLQNIYQRIESETKLNGLLKNKLTEQKQQNKESLARFENENVDKQDVDKAHFAYTVAIADVISAKQLHTETTLEIDDLDQELKRSRLKLQESQLKSPSAQQEHKIARLDTTIEFLRQLIVAEESLEKVLKEGIELKERFADLQESFHKTLLVEYNNQQNELRERYILSLNRHMQAEQSVWLKKLSDATKQLEAPSLSDPDKRVLEIAVLQAEEKMTLASHKLKIAKLHDRLMDISDHIDHSISVQSLDGDSHKLTLLSNELTIQEKKIRDKVDMLNSQKAIQHQYLIDSGIGEKSYQAHLAIIQELEQQYDAFIKSLNSNIERIEFIKRKLSRRMNEALSNRQGLPGFDWSAWGRLTSAMLHIPVQGYELSLSLYKHVLLNLSSSKLGSVVLAYIIPIAFFLAAFLLRHYLDIFLLALASSRQHRLTSNFLFGILQVLRRNLIGLYAVFTVIFFLKVLEVPYHFYRFVVLLSIVWFAFRVVSIIGRLSLVETISDVSGDDVRLFNRLNRTLVIGGLITALAVLAKELNVPYDVQDLISRLLMLFMFVVATVLLWGHYVFPNLFRQRIGTKRQYLLKAINLMAFLIPLNVLIIAVVGMIGYVQLAWRMSYYQMIFIVVLAMYVVVRGTLTDLMDFVSDWVIRHARNGWLISEALLKPIDRIIRLCLIFLALVCLFISYGWGEQSIVVQNISSILYFQFVSFKGGQISLISIFEFAIVLSVLIWATRWAREFSYRVLFNEVRDPGLRKSLATFFQYAVGIFGFIPTLWILGIDFTGLGMIVSALAIGIGFGLREFANNLVSGVLLLMERPVKEGDIVSIGGHDGMVTHIGMRSMMVQSWDHTEVMVPNSEVFNKVFTNWTYHDGIVRTTLAIKIQRQDDPMYVQSLIYDVLTNIEEVLNEPEPEVLLSALDDALIEFQVRYFLDVSKHSRFVLRSKVLFNIWQRFKACGIKAPFPQQDIKLIEHVKDERGDKLI